jgi:hypothetical protein
MDATISPKLTSLLQKLRRDHAEFSFVIGDISHWSPADKKITVKQGAEELSELLHELAHAILNHQDFTSHSALLRVETSAWQYACDTLGPRYGVVIDHAYVEDALASYRQWYQAQSACPTCGATGMQENDLSYRCLGCIISWKTNDARQIAGRRFIV